MSAPETRFAVLLFTDIVGSTELKLRRGVPAYSEALRTHNGHFERLARESRKITILQNMGDGYFAEAGGIAEALRFALLFQEAMRDGPWQEIRLTTRVGIHAGEVSTVDSEGGSGIVAPAADLAARVMSLAVGGQILLTRPSFDEARHFIREHPAVSRKSMPPLCWLAHGPYQIKGRDEPIEIYEVGAEGLAPLVAPPDGEKAIRAIRPGEEETLGWRPAIGLEIPGRIGWHLTGLLGAGGFGEVWAGEHEKLRQSRAFKFCFDDERLRALKREVTLVRLLQSALGQRDDIVHIHELKLDTPPFYLESDLAPHGNLLQWAEKQGGLEKIPLARRIALVAHTATALAAAHSIGVLHKDIKPTNILIFDGPEGEPRPRLVDFGIGTLADTTVLGDFGVTAAGFTRPTIQHSTGTPTYSPPEYLAGRPYTIQGDIYGLGVLLYQLVTAKPLDPLAPGWERDISDSLLREDIAACVDGDPARRLPSAVDLAERLLHLEERRAEIEETEHLEREAAARAKAEVSAIAARLRAARFRKLAAAFAVLALLAIASGVVAWVSRKHTAFALAQVERKNEELDRKIAQNYEQILEAARKAHGTARDLFAVGKDPRAGLAHLADALHYNSQLPVNRQLAVLHDDAILRVLSLPPVDPSAVGEPMRHENWVASAGFSPDGRLVVTASGDKTARLWDTATGKSVGEPMWHEDRVRSACFSPDGRRVVTASDDMTARLWDAVTGTPVGEPMRHENWVASASFSPDSGSVVTASADHTARLWNAATGKPIGEPMPHEDVVGSASFSPDGRRVVTASTDKAVRLWDVASGKPVGEPLRSNWNAVFSPDGRLVVTASGDDTARLWDAATGMAVGEPMRHEKWVTSAGFSPDSGRVVTASEDKTARLWDAATGKPMVGSMRHEEEVTSASFSPDGRRVVTVSARKTARLWDTDTGSPVGAPMRHEKWVTSAGFSPDGRCLVTVSDDHTARLWDAASGNPLGGSMRHEAEVTSASFSPDGRRVVTVSVDHTARLWSVASGMPMGEPMRHGDGIDGASFSPDGRRVVICDSDHTVWLCDVATGKPAGEPMQHENVVCSARFSPDGRRVVTASVDHTAHLWDAAAAKTMGRPMRHDDVVKSASFSPDGSRIVTASTDKTVRIWDAATGNSVGEPMRHESSVLCAEFSPDGQLVVTGSEFHDARLWDVATGNPVGEPMPHEEMVESACFSADGSLIVTTDNGPFMISNTARLWDAATGKPLGEPMRHEGEGKVTSASFSPDGRRVVTAGEDKTARLWDAATGKPIGEAMRHESEVRSACFSPNGRRVVTVTDDHTARLWDTDLHAFPGMTVNPDDLSLLAGLKINEDGEAVDISQSEITAWHLKLLSPSAAKDDAWQRLLRWKLSDPSARTITFYGNLTAPEHIEREVTWVMSHLDATKNEPRILNAAYGLDPGSPLIHLALAAIDENGPSRTFLIDFGLQRLAAAETVSDRAAHQALTGTYRAKAAIILALQGENYRATEVFATLLAKRDPQRQTWGSPAWIERLDDFEWPREFRDALLELAK